MASFAVTDVERTENSFAGSRELKHGVTAEQAASRAQHIQRQYEQQIPNPHSSGRSRSAARAGTGDSRETLSLLGPYCGRSSDRCLRQHRKPAVVRASAVIRSLRFAARSAPAAKVDSRVTHRHLTLAIVGGCWVCSSAGGLSIFWST